jgi:hypothetical protein
MPWTRSPAPWVFDTTPGRWSPDTGFSVKVLADLAIELKLGLVPGVA